VELSITARINATGNPNDRTPVIDTENRIEVWTDPQESRPAKSSSLLVPDSAEKMDAWPVRGRVNFTSEDGPALLSPATEPTKQKWT